MESIEWLLTNWDGIVQGVLAVLGGFAILARFTPNKSDDRIVQSVLSLINGLAMNNGRARNADDA